MAPLASLGEAFPAELKRCIRLFGEYRELGHTGMFGALMIAETINEAIDAMMANDLIKMINLYERMKAHN